MLFLSGDWIAGVTGNANSSGTATALNDHLDHKTVMSLLIVDRAAGSGQYTSFHLVCLGDFLLRGFSLSGAPPYFDLVYIGPSNSQLPLCS